MFVKKVYTSLLGLENSPKVEFHSYKELNDEFVEWIEQTTMELLDKSTYAENKLKSIFDELHLDYEQQVFFMINGRSYFIDFYLPAKNWVIEVDGASHKVKKKYDAQRDKDFDEVGFHTFRISNKEVYDEFSLNCFINILNVNKKPYIKTIELKKQGDDLYKISEEMIIKASTNGAGAGYHVWQFDLLGIKYPPRKGWKDIVKSRKYPLDVINEFINDEYIKVIAR